MAGLVITAGGLRRSGVIGLLILTGCGIAQAQGDSLRVHTLRDQAQELASTQPHEALVLAQEAERLVRVWGDLTALSRVLGSKGLVYEYLDSLDRALATYDEGTIAAQRAGDASFAAALTLSKGIACFSAGDFIKAHEFYDEALLHFEEHGDLHGASKALNNIGVIYRNTGQHEQAIATYHKSLEIKTSLNDSMGIANTYNNLGFAHNFLEQDSLSKLYFERALDLFTILGSDEDVALAQAGLGISLYNVGRPEEALTYLELSYPQISRRKNWNYAIHAMSYGRTLHDLGRIEESRPLIQEGYAFFKHTGQRKSLLKYAEYYMYQLARADGDIESALLHLESYKALHDSISNEHRDRLFSEMQAKYELRGKENTILKQNLEIEQAAKVRIRMAGSIVLFVFLALSGGWFGVLKQRANKALSEQKALVERALSDREMMLREVHHRVKNNLQIISGLLSIQRLNVRDDAAREAINSSHSRVRSMSLIHQHLYHDGDTITTVEMPAYVANLTKEVIDTMGSELCEITCRFNIEVRELDVDVAIPIGLILNELVTNCVKHAFVGRDHGILDISLYQLDQLLVLHVQDDGCGLPVEFAPSSFGHRMMTSLSESMNASLELRSEHGVHAELRVPLRIS